ncbi:MAG: site-specific DNA-methyltransferase [Selenomonadaceae bacterium]|nr:site-specific DNA-methyltransferase [Selenomonadaceae bacterium]
MPNLNFVGKSKVVNYHRDVSFRFLEHQYGSSENMIIHGDNLLALRSLLATHRGKIKCIYIDPPYNTGNENWIYNDNVNDPEIKTWIGKVVGDEETDLNRHDKWLCMMYPRLRLLHELLSDDGVIFISIDDNEVANLKLICQEIFGSRNFLAQIIWERAYAPVNLKKHFSTSHDYILCYAKKISEAVCHGIPRTEKTDSMYGNPDNDPRGLWRSDNLSVGPAVERNIYEITGPTGKKFLPPSGRCWRVSREKYDELLADNRIWFGSDGNNVPSFKRFLSDVKQGVTPMTIWKYTEVGHSQDATKQLKEIFDGKSVFQYPKSVELIKRCLQLYSDPDSIILDAFAGSGTTAQSVIELNREDSGNRKFILIELMDYCESITAERVRRVGGDFSFYELGDPIFVDGELNPDLSKDLFRRYLYFSETKKEIPPMNPDEPTLLGINDGIAYHLIDGDLNFNSLAQIKTRSNSYVIYAESCTISQETRDQFKIYFKKIPRDIRRI